MTLEVLDTYLTPSSGGTKGQPSMEAHLCNPSYSGGRDRKIKVPGQLHGKKCMTLSEK
jgi:hypothetical protein